MSAHPYHEACAKCWGRYQALERRKTKLESALAALMTHYEQIAPNPGDEDHAAYVAARKALRLPA